MDVTCERCSTEYEFDDALVSERGTTVKCTNCGYQFKVRRAGGSLPERWIVRTVDGRELEFTMLRELQAAISAAQITRDDVLCRGNSRPRRLGSIAELEPFFGSLGGMLSPHTAHGIGPGAQPNRVRTVTPQGLGGPAPGQPDGSVAIPLPRGDGAADRGPESISESETVVLDHRPNLAPRPLRSRSFPPASSEGDSVTMARAPIHPSAPPGVVVAPGEAPPLPDGFGARRSEPRPATRGRGGTDVNTLPAGMSPIPVPATPTPRVEVVSATERSADGSPPMRRDGTPISAAGGEWPRPSPSTPPALTTPGAQGARGSYYDEGYGDPRFSTLVPPKRTGAARWIVGLVMTGMAALAVMTLGARYLRPSVQAPIHAGDERIPALLREGERSLLDGDLETAKDKFVKASALGEDDPSVVAALARVETVGADMRWLRLRLLAPDDPDVDAIKQELQAAIERAHKAVDHARAVAAADPVVSRAAIDVLRMDGDLAGARKLVGAISASSDQPENALTLAALDLAEEQPSWVAVIERLRTAATGEQNLGRARAFLIYALARSGDFAGARTEHERLLGLSRPHPLARALRAFIDRSEQAAGKTATDGKPSGSASPSAARAEPHRRGAGAATSTAPGAQRGVSDRKGGRGHDEVVVPNGAPNGAVDTSDLPGVKPPVVPSTASPAESAQPPAKPSSEAKQPEIDTSDLPGFKHE